MTPLPVIANTFRCALNWATEGSQVQTAENVIHLRGTLYSPAGVGEALEALLNPAQFHPMSESAALQSISVTPLDGSSGSVLHVVTRTDLKGGVNADWVPAAAAVVSLHTALRGRSHRGRVYIPFINESDAGDGYLADATPAALETAWAAFQTRCQGDEPALSQVVASYKLATASDVITYSVRAPIGTMRRRQDRVARG